MKNRTIFLLFICCFQIAQGFSIGNPAGSDDTDKTRDYRIGPGDVLSISVFGLNDFDQEIRVSNSGKIHIPHLGVLRVNSMTASQLQNVIAQNLIQKNLIKDPWIQVRIVEYRAHPVYILGEVMQPGQFLMKDEMYLTDLISLSAGFNDVAGPVGYLYRYVINDPDSPGEDTPTTEEAIPIDFQQLFDGSEPELNMKLRGGDVLYVPQRQQNFFYVVGDVQNPKAFEVPFGKQILVSQAIAQAGGPLKTAKLGKGLLLRYDNNGIRQDKQVDFNAILKGSMPDFPVMPDDIIFIPGSSAKTLGYGLLDVLPRVALGSFIF
jgi:polysaccharide export outer membrane protein